MRTLPFLLALLLLSPGLPVFAGHTSGDAGSGRDAGSTPGRAVAVAPGVTYEGELEPAFDDTQDWFSFHAEAGTWLEVAWSGDGVCVTIVEPSRESPGFSCAQPLAEGRASGIEITSTGTWHLAFSTAHLLQDRETHEPLAPSPISEHYRFRFQFSTAPPEPAPSVTGDLAEAVLSSLVRTESRLPLPAPASESGKHVVVAVIDSGINPYHEYFRAAALANHPSQWLPGFPASARTLPLTLDATNVPEARGKDAPLWDQVEGSTYDPATDAMGVNLYTFPGTRIVGALSFGPPPAEGRIYDGNGHGTGSAGLAAGANLRDAQGDVLIVAVQAGSGTYGHALRWAARQPWIDVVSVSLGTTANVPDLAGAPLDDSPFARGTREVAASGKALLIASGNGLTNSGIPPDHCLTYTSAWAAPPWTTRIGAAEPRSGNPTWWHCVPVEAVARTDVPSPVTGSLTVSRTMTGTSAATPNAAGHLARLLLDARRAGLDPAPQVALQHLLNASAPAPLAPGPFRDPSLAATAPVDQGYGLIDDAALTRARGTLLAGSGPTPRPELDAWWAVDRAVRSALWGTEPWLRPWEALGVPPPLLP